MKHYNFNSSKNQAIKKQFVEREVYACISDMAEYLFSYDGDKYADWDEWENIGAIHEEEPETKEILEFWIVSPWLGEKLMEKGEAVLKRWGGWIWGRTCTGQAISLDGVISEICYDIEILEGQPYEWKI